MRFSYSREKIFFIQQINSIIITAIYTIFHTKIIEKFHLQEQHINQESF